jgi:hypothetical protein
MPEPEPEDARPAWMDPDAQDEATSERGTPRDTVPPARNAWQRDADARNYWWRREADVRDNRRAMTLTAFACADPETMALRELVKADELGDVAHQQLHATKAAAWASLAVLRELRTHHGQR